ncbi:hypothetical protein EV121DRAFT_262191 [Schizophyllum commune]
MQNGLTSAHDQPSSSRVTPLAPLEYLQNQRRGSITDPSLHAAGVTASPKQAYQSIRYPDHSQSDPRNMSEPRPAPSYVFGDATPRDDRQQDQHPPQDPRSKTSTPSEGSRGDQQASQSRPDYPSRRPSAADAHPPQGTKRKMSGDRSPHPGNGEIDPQLVGPGGITPMDVDPDAPAAKRRGSAVDARIGQLNLNDRRGSTAEARPWWAGERRDSAPSVYAPGVSSGSTYTLPVAGQQYPWAPPPGQEQPPPGTAHPQQAPEGSPQAGGPPVHSQAVHPAHATHLTHPHMMMQPVYTADRRMSMPESTTERVLRSRQRGSQDGFSPAEAEAANALNNRPKDPNTTPYSRSPELRVSHKLAERKRRKEMKELFDELRDQLPADRGMKASKWEILSKAIDFVQQMKQTQADMAREMELMRQEIDAMRSGGQPPPHAAQYQAQPPPHVIYGQPGIPTYVAAAPAPTTAAQAQPIGSAPPQSHTPISRPPSSQNGYAPSGPTPPGTAAPQPANGRADTVPSQ